MRILLLLSLSLLAAALSGCPGDGKPTRAVRPDTPEPKPSAAATPAVQLLRTDLGLADGQLIREADAALSELAAAGRIAYGPVGDLPAELAAEAGEQDVGLPAPPRPDGRREPGTMTAEQASALAAELTDCDLLIVGTAAGYSAAAPRLADGSLSCAAVLLLDGANFSAPQDAPVPVHSLRYDIDAAGFLLGVAAATNSASQGYIGFVLEGDAEGQRLMDAVFAGCKQLMNGAQLVVETVPPGEGGVISPPDFLAALERVRRRAGPAYNANHYFASLGRATPSALLALSKEPISGTALGAFGDFTPARPARIICCAVKHPAPGLRALLDASATAAAADDPAAALRAALEAQPALGLADGAVDVTGFDSLARFRGSEAQDLREAVGAARAEILAGELDVADQIERFKAERY